MYRFFRRPLAQVLFLIVMSHTTHDRAHAIRQYATQIDTELHFKTQISTMLFYIDTTIRLEMVALCSNQTSSLVLLSDRPLIPLLKPVHSVYMDVVCFFSGSVYPQRCAYHEIHARLIDSQNARERTMEKCAKFLCTQLTKHSFKSDTQKCTCFACAKR